MNSNATSSHDQTNENTSYNSTEGTTLGYESSLEDNNSTVISFTKPATQQLTTETRPTTATMSALYDNTQDIEITDIEVTVIIPGRRNEPIMAQQELPVAVGGDPDSRDNTVMLFKGKDESYETTQDINENPLGMTVVFPYMSVAEESVNISFMPTIYSTPSRNRIANSILESPELTFGSSFASYNTARDSLHSKRPSSVSLCSPMRKRLKKNSLGDSSIASFSGVESHDIDSSSNVWAFKGKSYYPARVTFVSGKQHITFADVQKGETTATKGDFKPLILPVGAKIRVSREKAVVVAGLSRSSSPDTVATVDGYVSFLVRFETRMKDMEVPLSAIHLTSAQYDALDEDLEVSLVPSTSEDSPLIKHRQKRQRQRAVCYADVSIESEDAIETPIPIGNSFKDCIFLISMVEERERLTDLITAEGGAVYKECSSLFTQTGGRFSMDSKTQQKMFACVISNRPARTPKNLLGLSLGWPCLKSSFVDDVVAGKAFVDDWRHYLLSEGPLEAFSNHWKKVMAQGKTPSPVFLHRHNIATLFNSRNTVLSQTLATFAITEGRKDLQALVYCQNPGYVKTFCTLQDFEEAMCGFHINESDIAGSFHGKTVLVLDLQANSGSDRLNSALQSLRQRFPFVNVVLQNREWYIQSILSGTLRQGLY